MKTETAPLLTQDGLEHGADVSIRSVTRRYGDIAAVDNVSLDITAGSFVALLGPSGSGKSTLLSVIAGLTTPTSGEILVNGRDVTSTPPNHRNMGVVFQDYALFPHMSVAENIAFPLQARKLPKDKVARRVGEALELVELTAHATKPPAQLSGGQRQRVALARTLVFQPPIILLDEPLGALDRRLRESLQAELKQVHQRAGSTFIMVTHDQDEALGLADTVVVMRDGKMEQAASPADMYDYPRTPFVSTFVGDCNLVRGALSPEGVTHAGQLIARSDGGYPLSGEVAIRPEKLLLTPTASTDASVPLTITYERFTGRSIVVRGNSPLGPLVAELERSDSLPARLVGHTLTLHWDTRSVHALPALSTDAPANN